MSAPYYQDDSVTLWHGDALAVLQTTPSASVDALVTDPPYSSGGMMRGDRAQPGTHRKYSGTFTPAGVRELVKIVPAGGVVLDPFMGAGTTGVAAAIESRRFIGVELADHYAEIAERRIRSALGQAVGRGSQAAIDFGQPA